MPKAWEFDDYIYIIAHQRWDVAEHIDKKRLGVLKRNEQKRGEDSERGMVSFHGILVHSFFATLFFRKEETTRVSQSAKSRGKVGE